MHRLIAFALFAALLTVTPAEGAGSYRYDPYGPHLDMGASTAMPCPLPAVCAGYDADGIPVVDYQGTIGVQYNPFSVAANGLVFFSSWLYTRNAAQFEQAVRDADWLVRAQEPDGRWLYRFPLIEYGIAPPWPSAISQGAGMSLLVRMWRYTGDSRYLRAAKRALLVYSRPVEKGGTFSYWQGSKYHVAGLHSNQKFWFWDEAPNIAHPSFILNGFMYALLGLYDMSVAAPRSTAKGLYARGWRSLVAMLPLYDYGDGWSAYNLEYLTRGAPKILSSWYNGRHVVLLKAINSVTPNPVLAHYMNAWSSG